MKVLFTSVLGLITVSALSLSAMATTPKAKTAEDQICELLNAQYDDQCAHLMCDGLVTDGTFTSLSDCTSAGDYAEAAQASCEDITTVEDLAQAYNHAHPSQQVSCF